FFFTILFFFHSFIANIFFNFIFFFQAEDGIRDFHVTGVQTCALPICRPDSVELAPKLSSLLYWNDQYVEVDRNADLDLLAEVSRSEERRVGKDCRSKRWE